MMSPAAAALKTAIVRDLDRLEVDGLGEIRTQVAALLAATGKKGGERKSLAGIWQGHGFERIVDLEGEIREARKDLSEAIARRRL
jgi:hypothetical protein